MRWIAPPEKDAATVTLEKRLWDAADQFRANSGLKAQEYSGPILGLIFLRFADSQAAHGQPLLMPSVSTMFDYEGELAIVISKPGRAISEADALDYVAGYACYNDASVRDWQWHTRQFTPGKNFPQTGALGPVLVTADEIPDPSVLSVTNAA